MAQIRPYTAPPKRTLAPMSIKNQSATVLDDIWIVLGFHPPTMIYPAPMAPSWRHESPLPIRVAQLRAAGNDKVLPGKKAPAHRSLAAQRTGGPTSAHQVQYKAKVVDQTANNVGSAKAEAAVHQLQQPVLCTTRWRKAWTEEYCIHCGRNPAFLAKNMRVCLKPPKPASRL
ncbi:hypothetical protein CspeluHIS016_0403620 [Cutaneotrichosporon spelunceum]|uniref:Uncharacterized protein n=1 Tax=Cutaneotrichosporon spelunceum TaxID=1672016 RepID=A0AAD3TVQ0_9TREE|nr:hypothetical protein CspeluHIS016_0403620 [Cutaneotrichosporon spelunceum]